MITETLNLAPLNDIGYLGLITALILSAGIVSGIASFYLTVKSGWWLDTPLWREIIQGLISALTFPLLLHMLSSTLISSPRLDFVDYLRLFGLAVCYCLIVRQLIARLLTGTKLTPRTIGLSLIEIEILRSVDRNPIRYGELPELPPDLGASPEKVAMRIRDLLDSGLLCMRTNDQKTTECFVTASGWSSINRALNYGAENY